MPTGFGNCQMITLGKTSLCLGVNPGIENNVNLIWKLPNDNSREK
jgi:hypothetical protein